MCVSFASAEKKEIITLKQGDPLILLQKKKTAIFEIDYSQMVVTDGKNHEDDMPFYEWMKIQDEDNDKWTEDWESKDKEKCYKAFRDNFNSELKNGLKLTKLGKDYKAIFRINQINFGNAGVTYTPTLFFKPRILCFKNSSISIANSSLYSSVSPRYINTVKNGVCPLVVLIELHW